MNNSSLPKAAGPPAAGRPSGRRGAPFLASACRERHRALEAGRQKHIIITLFDYSMSWSLFYEKAGYKVVQVDLKAGIDILKWNYRRIGRSQVAGILAAPPCTDYTVACNRYWAQKDKDGSTAASNLLINKTLEIVDYFNPDFWGLENPGGRLTRMLAGKYLPGEPKLTIPKSLKAIVQKPALKFNPDDYGDPWTKQTLLWGQFNTLIKRPVEPLQWALQGSWTQLLGGKNERTKEIRSVTPSGFARAFFDANNPLQKDIGDHITLFGRCKYGLWTCDFAVCQEMCNLCKDGSNYEPNQYADTFATEEAFMKAIFNKGAGILLSANPKNINNKSPYS